MTEIEEKLLKNRLDIMTQNTSELEKRIGVLEDLLKTPLEKQAKKKQINKIVPDNCLVVKYRGNIKVSQFKSVKHAARITGIQESSIYKCLRGENQRAGGFRWGIIKKENG